MDTVLRCAIAATVVAVILLGYMLMGFEWLVYASFGALALRPATRRPGRPR